MRNKPFIFICKLVLVFCCTGFSLFVLAEKADRQKPVKLESDRMTVDDTNKLSLFEGNVVLSQGTLLIRADKMIVRQDKEGFHSGIAYGRPATFKQKRDGVEEYIEGFAQRIEYDAKLDKADLYVQARLKRENDEVSGDHIAYDGKTQFYSVNPEQTSSSTGRVRVTIQPKK